MKERRTRRQLTKALFMNQSLDEYRGGDPESYDLLTGMIDSKLKKRRADSTEICKIFPGILFIFMPFDPELLPAREPSATFWGYGAWVRIALQEIGRNKHGFGTQNHGRATTYIAAIIEAADVYFRHAKSQGKKKAFHWFQINVEKSFKLRELLIRYNQKPDPLDHRLLKSILKSVRRIRPGRDVVNAPALMHFVHAHKVFCGLHSSAQDNFSLKKLRHALTGSSSMHEFLTRLIETDQARASKAA